MIFLIIIFILVLLFSIQTTLLELFSIGNVTPDLALILVVYCGMHFKNNGGIKMGILVGFIQDCLSGGLLGVNTLSKGLIGLLFSALKDKILLDGVLPVSYFLITASLIDGVIYFAITTSLMDAQNKLDLLIYNFTLFGIYNAVVGLFLFYMFDKVRKWIHYKTPHQTF